MSSPLSPAALWKRLHRTWDAWRAAPHWAAAYLLVSLVIFVLGHQKLVSGLLLHQPPCDSSRVQPINSPASYSWLLHWASRPSHRDAITVYIPEELPEIQQNVCRGREYLADVLVAIQQQHPAVVVIDKSFSQHSCSLKDDDKQTTHLVSTISGLPFPVIVGTSAKTASKDQLASGVCLCVSPGLSLGPPGKVQNALLRPNADLTKIPLQWRGVTFNPPQPQTFDTLALATFQTFAPETFHDPDFQSILSTGRAPYAYLVRDPNPISTVDLICQKQVRDLIGGRWLDQCERKDLQGTSTTDGVVPSEQSLLGKVVLIGARDGRDQVKVLNETYWGYELQEMYINALISGTYLLAPPWQALIAVYLFFILVNAVLFPPDGLVKARSGGSWVASTAMQLMVVLLLTCAYVAAFLLFHCLPPLDAFLLFLPAVLNQVLLQVQQGSNHHVKKHGRQASRSHRHTDSQSPAPPTAHTRETA